MKQFSIPWRCYWVKWSYIVSYLVWPHRKANHPVVQWLSGLVHEKSTFVCLTLSSLPLKALTLGASTIFLIQTVPASYCTMWEVYYPLSLIHPVFYNFNVWPLVPLTLASFVNSSLMSVLVNPLYTFVRLDRSSPRKFNLFYRNIQFLEVVYGT